MITLVVIILILVSLNFIFSFFTNIMIGLSIVRLSETISQMAEIEQAIEERTRRRPAGRRFDPETGLIDVEETQFPISP
jgi:hypothetical protein